MADPSLRGDGFARGFVPNKFDAHHHTALADISHERQAGKGLEQAFQECDLRAKSRKGFFFAEDLEVCQCHRAAQGIAGIAVAVKERLELFVLPQKRAVDGFSRQRGGQGHISAGQPLADGHQIRGDALMLTGKHLSCAAKSCRHFIGDEQHIILSAEFTDALQVAGRGHDHAGRGLHQWFDDKSGDLAMPGFEQLFDRIEAGHVAGGIGEGERTAVTVGGLGVEGWKQKWFESAVKQLDIPDTDGPDRVAVVSQLEMQKGIFGSGLRTALLPILDRHLERDFNCR